MSVCLSKSCLLKKRSKNCSFHSKWEKKVCDRWEGRGSKGRDWFSRDWILIVCVCFFCSFFYYYFVLKGFCRVLEDLCLSCIFVENYFYLSTFNIIFSSPLQSHLNQSQRLLNAHSNITVTIRQYSKFSENNIPRSGLTSFSCLSFNSSESHVPILLLHNCFPSSFSLPLSAPLTLNKQQNVIPKWSKQRADGSMTVDLH